MNAKEQHKILEEIRKYLSSDRDLLNNVLDVQLGYKIINGLVTDELSIRFIVREKLTETSINKAKNINLIPKTIVGIKSDVIQKYTKNESASYIERFDPIVGGIEILNNDLYNNQGTLSCILEDNNGNSYCLSCYHVIFGMFENGVGGDILQPGIYEINNIIATANLHNSIHNKEMDVVAFPINNRSNSNFIYPFNKPLKYAKIPVVGDNVKKSGIATGVTYGILQAVSVFNSWSVSVGKNYNKMSSTSKLTDFGDSGSLWVLDTNQTTNLQGIAIHTGISDSSDEISLSTSLKHICSIFKLNPY